MKLGLKSARRNHRTLLLADYFDRGALPAVPPATRYRDKVAAWPVLLNDRIGDCAVAAPLHAKQLMRANAGKPYTPTDAEALAAYEAVGGYRPGDPSSDRGCVLLDVMNYWRKAGIGGGTIDAYAALRPGDHGELIDAVYLFGGAVLGARLPRAWQGAKVWQAPASPVGPWQPGSWGGHAIPVVDYDSQWLYVVSWGQVIPMSWPAYDAYVDEAYVPLDRDWFGDDGLAANGFDWQSLLDDLRQMTGQDFPVGPGPAPVRPPAPPAPVTPPPAPTPALATLTLAAPLGPGVYHLSI